MAQNGLTESGKLTRIRWIAVGFGIVVLAALVGVSAAVILFARSDVVCRGVTLAGVNLGGVKQAEAQRRLSDWWGRRRVQSVTLTALDSRRSITFTDVGAQFDPQKAALAAARIGREGPVLRRFAHVLVEESPDKHLTPQITIPEKRLRETVKALARSVNKSYKDARLKVVDSKFVVEPEEQGVKLDEESALTVLQQELLDGGTVIPLPIEIDKPKVTAADVGRIDALLSSFTTHFNPGKRDRTHNLILAANAVNGIILKSGQRFSYNAIVGERVTDRGYRNAPIFVRGNLEPGIGGGICQVSSTIYNAALLAGLRVVERSHHSRTVPYVRPGRDATVAYGLLDLRFENTNANPIGLIAVVKGSLLSVYIYGHPADKKKVEVYTSAITYTAASTKTITDPALAPGASKIVDHGSPGANVTVYRKLYGPDGSVVTETVSRDRYLSQPKIVARGPAAKPVTTAKEDSPQAGNDAVQEPE